MNLIDVEMQSRDFHTLAARIACGRATADEVEKHAQLVALRQRYERSVFVTTCAVWAVVGFAWIGSAIWVTSFSGWEAGSCVVLVGSLIVSALIRIVHA